MPSLVKWLFDSAGSVFPGSVVAKNLRHRSRYLHNRGIFNRANHGKPIATMLIVKFWPQNARGIVEDDIIV